MVQVQQLASHQEGRGTEVAFLGAHLVEPVSMEQEEHRSEAEQQFVEKLQSGKLEGILGDQLEE